MSLKYTFILYLVAFLFLSSILFIPYFMKHKTQCCDFCLRSQLRFKEISVFPSGPISAASLYRGAWFLFQSFVSIRTFICCHLSSVGRIFFGLSCNASLLLMKSFSFYMSKIFILPVFARYLYCISNLGFSLSVLERCSSTAFSGASFLMRNLLSLFLLAFVCDVPLYPGCFYSFPFITGFSSLVMICLCVVFFMLLFIELPGSVNLQLPPNSEKLQPLFS